jgi:hypothetical protein
MQELSEYRQHLLERMGIAAEEFRQACQAASDPGHRLKPAVGTSTRSLSTCAMWIGWYMGCVCAVRW